MSIPFAVVCHIAEKNSSVEELDMLIGLLKKEHNFSLLGGPSFDGKKEHLGTTLVKNVSGENAEAIFETVQKELEEIETKGTTRFACRLTVAAVDVLTEGIFIT
jgi:hypothetical protein